MIKDDRKVIVAYLYTKFDSTDNLLNFIRNYKKNPPGYNHELLICYKLLNSKEINSIRRVSSKIKHIEFIDSNTQNDFDFGSYKRIALRYQNFPIFFSLGHAYPVSSLWLKKLMYHFNKKSFIGSSVSNESIFSSFKNKKKFKIIFNLKEFFFLKKNFKSFPNPHIRTINFVLYGRDYLKFIATKKFNNKKDTWIAESGLNGMTNFFINKGFNVLAVNSVGESFTPDEFKYSETYFYKNQSKQLFSDKHSRKFDKMSFSERLLSSRNIWR